MTEIVFVEGEKVIFVPEKKVYDFGYYTSTVEGKCIIYEEGERNMQDSYAVFASDLRRVEVVNKDRIKKLVEFTASSSNVKDMAIGWLRYECVRRMNPRQFGEICKRNLEGEDFDDLIDQALLEWPFKPKD
jgi:hypothetical protein